MIDKIKIKDFLGTSINRVNVAQLTDKVNEIIQEINTESPATYKVYRATLNQASSNPPSARVLENTIGTVTFTYNGSGDYTFNFTGEENSYLKTLVFITATSPGDTLSINIPDNNTGEYKIINQAAADDTLVNSPFEIRLYN
jgi:hypothetical protein